ncbi:MAG: hypothetical protein IKK21_10855 [Clostridia bacterium]|nr:hypothetical protein [Clostridia bacterium]
MKRAVSLLLVLTLCVTILPACAADVFPFTMDTFRFVLDQYCAALYGKMPGWIIAKDGLSAQVPINDKCEVQISLDDSGLVSRVEAVCTSPYMTFADSASYGYEVGQLTASVLAIVKELLDPDWLLDDAAVAQLTELLRIPDSDTSLSTVIAGLPCMLTTQFTTDPGGVLTITTSFVLLP